VDGTLVTWGLDTSGELGRGIEADTRSDMKEYKTFEGVKKKQLQELAKSTFLIPKPVVYEPPVGKHTVLDVACGDYHILVVVQREGDDGPVVYSSGLNQYGQLGQGDDQNRNVLTLVSYHDTCVDGMLAPRYN